MVPPWYTLRVGKIIQFDATGGLAIPPPSGNEQPSDVELVAASDSAEVETNVLPPISEEAFEQIQAEFTAKLEASTNDLSASSDFSEEAAGVQAAGAGIFGSGTSRIADHAIINYIRHILKHMP